MEFENVLWGETPNGGFHEVLVVPDRTRLDAIWARAQRTPDTAMRVMDTDSEAGLEIALACVGLSDLRRDEAIKARVVQESWRARFEAAATQNPEPLKQYVERSERILDARKEDQRSPEAGERRRREVAQAKQNGGAVVRLFLGPSSGHRGLDSYVDWLATGAN